MNDHVEAAKGIILELLEKIGVHATLEAEDSITKGMVFNISARDSYALIGRQGTTLHALQIIAQAIVSRKLGKDAFAFTLDIDDYKRKREWYLKETAKAAAQHVKRTGRPAQLEPMPNYERRLVHAYLEDQQLGVHTSSQGREPHRRIVIKPKNAR